MKPDPRWSAKGACSVPMAFAWLLAFALNLTLWGQEWWLQRAPGLICLAQLGAPLSLLALLSLARLRRTMVTGYRALLVALVGVAISTLDLLTFVHPEASTPRVFQAMHWARSGESLGPLPTGLPVLLTYICLLCCQLQAHWDMQCANQHDYPA